MRRFLFLGIAVYLFFLIANFPAQLALHWFAPEGVTGYGVTGPIWDGKAQAIDTGAVILGETSWDLSVPWLLTGTATADVKSRLGQSRINSNVSRSVFGNTLKFKSMQGIVFIESLPPAALAPLRASGVRSLDGRLGLTMQRFYLTDGWPSDIEGSLDLVDLAVDTQLGGADLGSFELVFDAPADESGTLIGRLGDTDSPITLDGTVTLSSDRSFHLDATATAQPGASSDITTALTMLGTAAPGGGTRIQYTHMVEAPPQ